MKVNIRQIAADLIERIEQGAYTNLVLNEVLNKHDLDPRDKALLTNIVKGSIQWKTKIDDFVSPYVKSGINKLSPFVLAVLRSGAYQLLFLDKIPAHAAINESVEIIKRSPHKKASGLVNAVLRRVNENKLKIAKDPKLLEFNIPDLSKALSHPEFLVTAWIDEFGKEDTIALCEKNNQAWPLCIRTNTLKISTANLRELFTKEKIEYKMCGIDPDCTIIPNMQSTNKLSSMPGFKDNYFFVQDESSSIITRILNPKPGSRVIDLCASPGGKTASLALLMQNKGEIIAVDLNEKKCSLVKNKCLALGIDIVKTRVSDAQFLKESLADYVLVDAPCSGFGVLGRKPEIRWNRTKSDVNELTILQSKILQNASELLKPGGRLIHSTCTLLKAENQNIVESFLRKNPDFNYVIPDKNYSSNQFFLSLPSKNEMAGAFCALLKRN